METVLVADFLQIHKRLLKKMPIFFCLLLFASLATAQLKTTTYSGTITGYTGNMNFTTGQLAIENVVTGLRETHLITIQPNGTFSVSFPVTRNQECWISFPFFNSMVYFEPGKKIVQDFNIARIPKVTSVFKGDCAITNNDINKLRPILMDNNWDTIYDDVYQLTPEQYKAYFLQMQGHKLAMIDSVAKAGEFDKTAYRLALLNVKYNISSSLIHYNTIQEAASRKKNNISFNDGIPVKLKPGYYDFLRSLNYNDPSAMASWFYYMFINRLMHMDIVYDKAGRKDYTEEINKLKPLVAKDPVYKRTLEHYQNLMKNSATNPGELEKARPVVLTSLLQTDISLELDIMHLEPVLYNMDRQTDTLTDAALTELQSKIRNKFLMADVLALNKKIKQGIQDSKGEINNANNRVLTNTPANNILVNIVDKYKGKVIFIDFWATWCSPCMTSIQEIAPLKEELMQDKDIVFLYITNPSSPEKTYQRVMPGIKGEHYKLSEDQYNFLAQRFQINGIPHYAVVNKQGAVVDPNFRWSGVNEVKEKLMTLKNE